jgi:GR25 family glycosyltransferase involved in LPS biosynthesis
MTIIPQIHLINLERSAERLRLFRERNGHLSDVVRVAASDGATLNREALIGAGSIKSDLPYTPGALGCAMSHIKLWETAVAEDRSMTIFEDDIVVSRHFEKRAREVLSALPPDWDIIQWGYILNPLFVWVDLGVSKVRLEGFGLKKYLEEAGLARAPAPASFVRPAGLLNFREGCPRRA